MIDDQFKRILDTLDETGQRENTLIIYTSDHGELLGDHGLIYKGCRFFESLVRVPLIFSWPAKGVKSIKSDALVELVDLAPTLYEAAGLDIPHWVQGRSLAPLLRGETREHREFVRSEFYGAIDYPDQTHATMYRDRRWKLVVYHRKNICELYDLHSDPWEHRDLSDMGQRIRDRPLEEACGWPSEVGVGGEERVEGSERGEEARDLLVPVGGLRLGPALLAPRDAEAPLHEVREMADDLDRSARRRAHPEHAEAVRGIA